MNQIPTRGEVFDHALLRKAEAFNVLAELCRDLELTDTQLKAAQASYEAVGLHLSASEHPFLKRIRIYAHGSTALGTTVKPIGREEHDVDLIAHAPDFPATRPASELKKLVGDHLKDHGRYAPILEEKKRCWRLNYAREFHLDITPAIPNRACPNGGELVPDKQVRDWKPTNPKGYKELFERRAALMPSMRIRKMIAADSAAFANVEDFPVYSDNKGILRRIVQLVKRHRDIYFQDVKDDIAPISIILTTLAAQAYEYCVAQFTFDTEIDVLIGTVRMMPHFIERHVIGGRRLFVVPNETTQGENFAERWNTEPARAAAFYEWHGQALQDFEAIAAAEGMDILAKRLETALGTKPVRRVLDARTNVISTARTNKSLLIAPAVGLTLSSSARATPVQRNTHFGD
jgi:hypothetical protein